MSNIVGNIFSPQPSVTSSQLGVASSGQAGGLGQIITYSGVQPMLQSMGFRANAVSAYEQSLDFATRPITREVWFGEIEKSIQWELQRSPDFSLTNIKFCHYFPPQCKVLRTQKRRLYRPLR